MQAHNPLNVRGSRFLAFAPAGPKAAPPPGRTWECLMARALERAKMAAGSGEVPVGAVLVSCDGRILAESGNEVASGNDPAAHAEILALRQGAKILGNYRLRGCVLVCTLEPCLMCAGAIINARISGLVFGAADALAGAVISRADFYDLPGSRRDIWHMGGVLARECATVLRDFFMKRR